MLPPSDVSVEIRRFLLTHPGPYCEGCLAKGAGLDAEAVHAAFNPSRNNPYSFMPARCPHCEKTALCVAWVGEAEATSLKRTVASVLSANH